jgi:type I restriction enzyme S subunit
MRDTETIALAELAEVNPKVDLRQMSGDTAVSFIPMSDVTESGRWVNRQEHCLDDVRFGYTPFSEGDVLFAKITPCMENGKGAHAVGLKNGVGFGSTEFHVLRARGDNSARYLFHWLQARQTRTRAVAYMGGSAGQQRVQSDFFTNFRVPKLRADEQARIARVLDTVDELIAKTEAVIAKLRQVRAGLLHDLLTRGLDEHGQLRPPPSQAPYLYQPSPLGLIPKEWEVVYVSELGKIVTGATPPSSASGIWGHQLPFVTPVELSDDGTILPPERYLSKAGCLYVLELPAGSVLVVCIGSTLGKIGVAPWSCGTNQQINAVVCSSEHEPAFVASMVSRHIRQLHRWAGLQAVPIVNKSQFGRMLIPVSASGEQKRIVRVLSELDRKVSIEVDLNAKLHHLKSGLMTDLLTGRVRVPEIWSVPS